MILTIQFREDVTEEHEQQCILKRLPADQEATFVSIFDETIDFKKPKQLLKGADKLILGGSAALSMAPGHEHTDYKKVDHILRTLAPLTRYILEQDFPTLGACFGHQLIAHFAGSVIAYDTEQAESGVGKISLTPQGEQDPLFKDVSKDFYAITSHQDSVIGVPKGAALLARSERCTVHALRFGNNVYTTQFHSELDEQEHAYRVSLFPQYAAHAIQHDESCLLEGAAILQNFLAMR
ncbi:MAG: type 1 glutamine amidotransferase [Candidatus Saccharimonadales bacterium]